MTLSDTLLPEFDHEMANTRKILERIPESQFGWKPHEKSMTLGRLAVHLTEIPAWTVHTIQKDSMDVAPPGAPPYHPPQANSRQEVLSMFDRNIGEARAAIAAASDEHLQKPWSLLAGGKTVFTMPRIAVLRSMVMNHNIHHRAQLGVYLRLHNIPLPAIYGPSADETGM
ncbi:MAG: DinB family protein [Acidobacteria bacterium]|nr:DinB family protein [Acidobacteriota bacterium]